MLPIIPTYRVERISVSPDIQKCSVTSEAQRLEEEEWIEVTLEIK